MSKGEHAFNSGLLTGVIFYGAGAFLRWINSGHASLVMIAILAIVMGAIAAAISCSVQEGGLQEMWTPPREDPPRS